MRTLILNPPFLPKYSRNQRSPSVTKSGTLYFPIWLAYATGLLESQGHECKLLDAPADDLDLNRVLEIAREFKPGMIALDTSTPSVVNDVKVADALKEACPDAYVVMVGTHVTALPEETLRMTERMDACTRGEYDEVLADLAERLDKGEDPAGIQGLCYRGEDGEIILSERRAFMRDLNQFPFVADIYKRHLDYTKYFNPNALYPMVMIITARGCPNLCTFCMWPQTLHGQRYRYRSVENVADEFEWVEKNLPDCKAIFIEDDTLTASPRRTRQLCDELIKRGVKISWTCNTRADVDYDTLKAMKAANCRMVCVGFESGSQELLDNVKKGTHIPKMKEFVDNARRAGVLVHGCFMAGLPGENHDTLEETLQFAMDVNPDTAQFYPIQVYPGTELYDKYVQEGVLQTQDFSQWVTDEGLHNTTISFANLTDREMVEWCDSARRRFYLRPSYILYKMRQLVRHPQEIHRTLKAFGTFAKYLVRGSNFKRAGTDEARSTTS